MGPGRRAWVAGVVLGVASLFVLLLVPFRCLVPDCPPGVSCSTTCHNALGITVPFTTGISAPLLLGLAGGISALTIGLLFWIALALRPRGRVADGRL